MNEIIEYEFKYIPFNKNFPIKSCKIIINAKTRKEAELIALDMNWKFFDEDCFIIVRELLKGYEK